MTPEVQAGYDQAIDELFELVWEEDLDPPGCPWYSTVIETWTQGRKRDTLEQIPVIIQGAARA